MRLNSIFVSFFVSFLLSAFLNAYAFAEELQVKESGFYVRSAAHARKNKKNKEIPSAQGKEEVLCFVSPRPNVTVLGGDDFKVAIGDFETIWTIGSHSTKISLENKKITVEIRGIRVLAEEPFEFCEIPPEITEFSQIGNPEKYRLKRLTRPLFTSIMAGSTGRPKGSFPGCLEQGQIILLKDKKKYLAIKAVDFKLASDNSFTEENIEKNLFFKPIWKSMTYEWSFLQADEGEYDQALAQSRSETQGTSKAPFVLQQHMKKLGMITLKGQKTYFYIPGIDYGIVFYFRKEKELDNLHINYEIRPCLIERVWDASTNDQASDIKDPSSYKFYEIRQVSTCLGPGCFGGSFAMSVLRLHTIVLRLDNAYAAIRPLKIEEDHVVYQWKYWPSSTPPVRLADTTPNK